jgi:hypothetical protein
MLTVERIANQDRNTLLRELERLRSENNRLRQRRPKTERYSTTVANAIADAHTLVMAAWEGQPTGQMHMRNQHDMTRRKWEWAYAFLRYAGIAKSTSHWRSGINWATTDLTQAISLLEKAAKELDGPGAYKRLQSVLNGYMVR